MLRISTERLVLKRQPHLKWRVLDPLETVLMLLCGLLLERTHVRAEDERAGLENLLELCEYLRNQRRVLRPNVNEWYRRHGRAPV